MNASSPAATGAVLESETRFPGAPVLDAVALRFIIVTSEVPSERRAAAEALYNAAFNAGVKSTLHTILPVRWRG